MQGLWGKLWFRIVAALVVAPFIMTGAMILAITVFMVATGGIGAFDPSALVPPPQVLVFLIPAEYIMALPPMIAAEIGNRRHIRPLPAWICTLFLVLLGAVFTADMYAAMAAFAQRSMTGGLLTGIAILAASYAGALAISVALVSPLILRWHKDSRTAGDMAGMF